MFTDPVVALAGGAALALGFAGHCALMCGPVALAGTRRQGSAASAYLVGRITSYSLMGCLAGGLGRVIFDSAWARRLEMGSSALLALMLALTAFRLLTSARGPRERLLSLGTKPRRAWLGSKLALLAEEPLLLGAATALLPCGALYAALGAAAALGSAADGALLMGTFSLLTGLVLAIAAGAARRLVLTPARRNLLALGLFAGALLTVLRPLQSLASDRPLPCHSLPDGGHSPAAPQPSQEQP